MQSYQPVLWHLIVELPLTSCFKRKLSSIRNSLQHFQTICLAWFYPRRLSISSISSIITFVWILICNHHSHASNAMNERVYQQTTCNTTSSSLAQLALQNKFVCAAQCAHQYPTCNTAVCDANVFPQCVLYSEPMLKAKFVRPVSARVYDFQQLKFKGRVRKYF